MSHHPPSGMPYGHPPQRRHDMPYPPNLRPQQGYPAYYPPHMGAPMQPYAPHYPQQWYPYTHMQHHPPPPAPPPPRPYQHHPATPHPQPYTPLVVSSYSQPQAPHNVSHIPPPQLLPQQPPPQVARPPSVQLQSPSLPLPPSTPRSTNRAEEAPPSTSSIQSELVASSPAISVPKEPFFPPVPWLSVDDQSFPSRAPRRKRKITRSSLSTEPVTFPIRVESPELQLTQETQNDLQAEEVIKESPPEAIPEAPMSSPTPVQTPTLQMSDVASEQGSTQPTTPSSLSNLHPVKSQPTPTQTKSVRAVIPVIPAVPLLPPTSPTTPKRTHRDSVPSASSKITVGSSVSEGDTVQRSPSTSSTLPSSELSLVASETTSKSASPPAPPKSWADLVRSKALLSSSNSVTSSAQPSNGLGTTKSESLSEVLNTVGASLGQGNSKLAFLKPRGLVNTGNMCYMNSVLQILVFCIPFYEFLDRVGRRAAHSFKSETPLIDAMILFIREFPMIDSAESVEQIRLRLKQEDYEQYGDPFIPEYVYQVIRQLPRFRDMRRGHQQDAQEFLGFLLEELHEECAHAMRTGSSVDSGTSTPTGSNSNVSENADNEGGWMEVGHKQRPAITRSSGTISNESPITKIFGGKLRSELRVAGNKNSVTLEPYEPLQLDIGSPQVHNIVDALKGLTKPESMQGDFNSPRGPKATATKQVFIETLPPVLILHLKRFQYDNSTKQAEKIWKKVGYPLDLEIPREVFPAPTRNKLAAHGGFPKYRLIGVIYHHGKNASGGHYTVDVRRQDGHEWIRLDDTLIRRVRSEDVAEAGSEEDPKVLAAALERHKQQNHPNGNMFEQINHDDDEGDDDAERVWSQVNGHSRSKSTMNSMVNGAAMHSKNTSGRQTPSQKSLLKDNKVAYLLFYQRMLP